MYQSRIGSKDTKLILSQDKGKMKEKESPKSHKAKRKDSQRNRRNSKPSPGSVPPAKKMRTECEKCEKEIGPISIKCTWCEFTFCQPCSKLDEYFIQVYSDGASNGLSWKCNSCNKTSSTLEKLDKKLDDMDKKNEDRMVGIERSIDSMENKISAQIRAELPKMIKTEVDEMTKTLETKIEKNVKETEERVTRAIDENIEKVGNDLEKLKNETMTKGEIQEMMKNMVEQQVKESIIPNTDAAAGSSTQLSPGTQMRNTVASVTAEMREKNKREKRMIIYRLEEKGAKLKSDQEANDKDTVVNIATNVLGLKNLTKHDILLADRVGEKKEDNPRPLLIELSDIGKKSLILKRAANLQGSDFQHISIRHDMTLMERRQQQKLVAEARKKEEESGGKSQYRVRGPPWDMKIVKMRGKDSQEEVKASEEKMETSATVV